MHRRTNRVGYSWMTGSIPPDEAQRFSNSTFVINTRFKEICFLEASARAQRCRFRWRALSVTWRSSKRFSAQLNLVGGRNRQSPGYKAGSQSYWLAGVSRVRRKVIGGEPLAAPRGVSDASSRASSAPPGFWPWGRSFSAEPCSADILTTMRIWSAFPARRAKAGAFAYALFLVELRAANRILT